MRTKKGNLRKTKLAFIIIFVFSIFISPIEVLGAGSSGVKTSKYQSPQDLQMARLLFGGDIIGHNNLNEYARNYGGGDPDYSVIFDSLRDYVDKYDFMMLNCEFTTNPNLSSSGYPTFNSHSAIYDGLADIGVDVITTANNHCLDTGLEGVDYTIDAIRSAGIDNVGSYKDDKDYLIKDVNGIKIGILAYAEDLNGLDYLVANSPDKVDRLNPDLIRDDIENIIAKGADFVVIYPHWGREYESYPTDYQINLARAMIDWGADMVIGNHPHVIQPREEYQSVDGRKGIIYYSLGNLISNQNYRYFDNDQRVNQGLLLDTIIYKSKTDNKAKILNASYKTIWTDSIEDEYGRLNRSYVTEEYIQGPKRNFANDYMIEQMNIAEDMTYQTMHTILK